MSSVLNPFFEFEMVNIDIPELRTPRVQGRINDQLRERVISAKFQDNAKLADKLTITFDNSDLTLTDSPVFLPGNIIDFNFGYSDPFPWSSRQFGFRRHIVTQIKGAENLQIIAMEAHRYAMGSETRHRLFKGFTIKQIADFIAKEYAFDKTITQEPRREVTVRKALPSVDSLNQALTAINDGSGGVLIGKDWLQSTTDWDFLHYLASFWNFEFYIEGRVFHFHERGFRIQETQELSRQNSTFTRLKDMPLEYFQPNDTVPGSIMKFKIDYNILGVSPIIEARSIDPITKKENVVNVAGASGISAKEIQRQFLEQRRLNAVGVATDPPNKRFVEPTGEELNQLLAISLKKLGVTVERTVEGPDITIVIPEQLNTVTPRAVIPRRKVTSPQPDNANLRLEADGMYMDDERKTLQLTLDIIGDPTIRAKSRITVLGLGNRFSGLWHVNEHTHTISPNGFQGKLKLNKLGINESSFPSIDSQNRGLDLIDVGRR